MPRSHELGHHSVVPLTESRASPQRGGLPETRREKRGWPFTEAFREHAHWLGQSRTFPRISIVTPSYNQARFLEQTLQSVLRQDYPNLEYVVMDGGSSDGSLEIIRNYSPWLNHWTSAPDQGQSDAINQGFALSSGDILGWVNSDDFLAPATLFKVADAFAAASEVGAVVGIGHKIDPLGRPFYSPLPNTINSQSLLGWCDGNNFMQPACFFSRTAWKAAGPLRTDLDYCMDLALWFRMATEFEFKILPETFAFINTHGEAKTIQWRREMFAETALLIATQSGGWQHAKRLLFRTLQQSHRPQRDFPRRAWSKLRTLLQSKGAT